MNNPIKTITFVCILIALYFYTYIFYQAVLHPLPGDADSWDYHIPIALSILNGSFLTASFSLVPQVHNPVTYVTTFIPGWYYPGSSEAINAVFYFFHIPTLSNVFAAGVLLFACFKMARTFHLSYYYSLLFALTIITLNVIFRWLNTVSVDVWMGVWFAFGIVLLESPKKSIDYFALLGFVLGMLIGTKYTALYFIAVLFVFYIKRILKYCSLQRITAFFIPFTVFGLFWYIRNYLVTGNPFYPLARLGFKGPDSFPDTVWKETLHHPLEVINANFGEYHLWLFAAIVAVIYLVYQYGIKKEYQLTATGKIFLIGLINFFIYIFYFPTNPQVWIMVSSVRYSLAAFIPLILGVFMLASRENKEELAGYFAVANMILILNMAYYPKLIFFYLPLGLVIIYLLKKRDSNARHKSAKSKSV